MTAEHTPAGSGLLVVDKPAGLTSHDVVARVRRLARTRKVGHAGTLDPMATGVLLVGVNKATRLLGHLALTEKSYDACVRLGSATTTDDAEGEELTRCSTAGVTEEQVRQVLAGFVGDIEQRPSAVSAIKVDGRRAYDRVRAGEDVELPARPVTIHELVVHEVRHVDGFVDVDFSVRCSSGTYVRAIARDLGAALGVGGHLTSLRRTSVGPVSLSESTGLDRLLETGEVPLLTMAQTAERFFPVVGLDADGARDVGFGRALTRDAVPLLQTVAGGEGPFAVLDPDGEFLALYRLSGEDRAVPVAVFV